MVKELPDLGPGYYAQPCTTEGCPAFYVTPERDPLPFLCPQCEADDRLAAIKILEIRHLHELTMPLRNLTRGDKVATR